MSKITKVVSRQIFDSRGIPTIETEIFCGKVSSKAICPSGASTGSYEAFEKRDITNKKYFGEVFPDFSLLDLKIEHFRPQNRVRHVKILPWDTF